jgi:hypothetical protein
MVSKSADPLTRDRGFESSSLHRRVSLSRDFIFMSQEPRLSARVYRAAFPAQSAESRRARQHRAHAPQYLCGAIFQYRIFGDAVAPSCWVTVARPVPNEFGPPLRLMMLVDVESSDRAQTKPSTVR